MAQPPVRQADVNVRSLRAAEARQAIVNPVELRRGQVRSITLTVPLLTDRGSYLVVRLPDTVVQELLTQARALPEPERPGFVRDWVMRNQQAVLEQYIISSRGQRRFRYNVVPVQAAPSLAETTPRRVDQPPLPIRRNPLETVPPAVARREQQPVEPQPAGRGRVIQPGPAPQVPERPVAAPRPREEPREEDREFRGGSGTTRDPFRIYVMRNRPRASAGTGASEIAVPITIVNIGKFEVHVTISQLSRSRIQETYAEIRRLCMQVARQSEAGRGGRVSFTMPPLQQWEESIKRDLRGSGNADLVRYMESH